MHIVRNKLYKSCAKIWCHKYAENKKTYATHTHQSATQKNVCFLM